MKWPAAEPGKSLAHYLDELYLPGRKFEGTLLSTLAAVANSSLVKTAFFRRRELRPIRSLKSPASLPLAINRMGIALIQARECASISPV